MIQSCDLTHIAFRENYIIYKLKEKSPLKILILAEYRLSRAVFDTIEVKDSDIIQQRFTP